MADASGALMAPHACEGPIGGIATLHVDAAMPNFAVQEICSGVTPGAKERLWEEWMGFPTMRMVNGYFPLPDKPGLGFEIDEAKLARLPFQGTISMARPLFQTAASPPGRSRSQCVRLSTSVPSTADPAFQEIRATSAPVT